MLTCHPKSRKLTYNVCLWQDWLRNWGNAETRNIHLSHSAHILHESITLTWPPQIRLCLHSCNHTMIDTYWFIDVFTTAVISRLFTSSNITQSANLHKSQQKTSLSRTEHTITNTYQSSKHSLFNIALVYNYNTLKLGHAVIIGPSVWFINTRYKNM